MVKLIWFWLLGKTLKINIGYIMGNFVINQIKVESKFNGENNITIDLVEKNNYKNILFKKPNKKMIL
jgi:hypothetical protein